MCETTGRQKQFQSHPINCGKIFKSSKSWSIHGRFLPSYVRNVIGRCRGECFGPKTVGRLEICCSRNRYVAESMRNKIETTNKILYSNDQPTTSCAASTSKSSIPSTPEKVTDIEDNHQSDQTKHSVSEVKPMFKLHLYNLPPQVVNVIKDNFKNTFY